MNFFSPKKKNTEAPTATDAVTTQKPCCASKEPHTHAANEKTKPSVFEFFSSPTDADDNSATVSMLGHCQGVEGGLNACVWVPTSDRQHRIVF